MTTPPFTLQQAFDTMARHLFTQGKQSATPDGDCQYRGPDGLKCAVGALIPDELYDPEWDNPDDGGTAAYALPTTLLSHLHGTEDPKSLNTFANLLDDCQTVHDKQPVTFNHDHLYEDLQQVATVHKLSTDTLTAIYREHAHPNLSPDTPLQPED